MAHIMVCDDDKELLDYYATILKEAGHSIKTAENGEDGYRKIIREEPDMLITDHMMPKMCGLDLALLLRIEGLTFPIVLVTGENCAPASLSIKDFLVIPKPIKREKLLECIDRSLRNRTKQ